MIVGFSKSFEMVQHKTLSRKVEVHGIGDVLKELKNASVVGNKGSV